MKMKVVLCVVFCIVCILTTNAQSRRAEMKDYLNQELWVTDRLAGQSITLVKENEDYFILRKYFGSGVPVTGTIKYKVVCMSQYQIAFSEIADASHVNLIHRGENFILCVEEEGLSLYLNGLKIVLHEDSPYQ